MGWYDSSRVRGGQDFQVDSKAEIKWDYRGYIREACPILSIGQYCQATGTGIGDGYWDGEWEMGIERYPQSQDMTV